MKRSSQAMFVIGMISALAGCMTEEGDEAAGTDEVATSTSSEAVTLCREVKRFTYSHNGSVYRWHITSELWGGGRQFVDERRIGGGFYRQYNVISGVWSDCPHANENETLRSTTNGITVTLTGTHVCLPDGREEWHGSDYQRLLYRDSPFIEYVCE